mgnify:CR=1 FL=1
MEDSKQSKGRGSHIKRSWEDINKGGGEAPSPVEVSHYLLNTGSKRQLSREEVQNRINNYFSSCIEEYEDEDTNETFFRWRRNPTKAGLAIALGVTAETLSHYVSNRVWGKEYANTVQSTVSRNDFDLIQAAVSVIQSYYEGNLGKNRNNSGSIFWLLNVGEERWTNTQTIKTIGNDGVGDPVLTHEDIKQIIDQADQRSISDLLEDLPE